MPGTLYLIPNTLGTTEAAPGALNHIIPTNVQALTARLDYFVAENAKTARGFLKLIAIDHPLAKPLQEIEIAELNVNTPPAALTGLLAPLLAGRDCGLVSEAGVPAVADPGADLVRLAHQHGITVKPLVGPSSLLLAVMASGLNGQSFAFNGYLPTDAALRTKRIKELEQRSSSREADPVADRDAISQRRHARGAGGRLPAGDADLRRDRPELADGIDPHAERGEVEGIAGGGQGARLPQEADRVSVLGIASHCGNRKRFPQHVIPRRRESMLSARNRWHPYSTQRLTPSRERRAEGSDIASGLPGPAR